MAELLPAQQQQRLAVVLAKARQRAQDALVASTVRRLEAGLLAAQPLPQRTLARIAATLVGKHAPRDAQKPDARVAGHLVQTTPGDEEDLIEHILGIARGRPSPRICQYRTGMRAIESLKVLAGGHGGCMSSISRMVIGPASPEWGYRPGIPEWLQPLSDVCRV
jgi:hypothetical protein